MSSGITRLSSGITLHSCHQELLFLSCHQELIAFTIVIRKPPMLTGHQKITSWLHCRQRHKNDKETRRARCPTHVCYQPLTYSRKKIKVREESLCWNARLSSASHGRSHERTSWQEPARPNGTCFLRSEGLISDETRGVYIPLMKSPGLSAAAKSANRFGSLSIAWRMDQSPHGHCFCEYYSTGKD